MTLAIDLKDEEMKLLSAKAGAAGLSAEQCAAEFIKQALASPQAGTTLPSRIREIWGDMPDEIRAKLPADAAAQHDHYIYGVPKRSE